MKDTQSWLRLHDIRHSFAGFGAGGGMGLPMVGKLLGHANATMTARYAHLHAAPLRRASNAIGGTTAAALGDASVEAEIEAWPVELQAALRRIAVRIHAVGLERVGAPMAKHLEDKLGEMRPRQGAKRAALSMWR